MIFITGYSRAPNPRGFIAGSDEYQGTPGHPYTSASITFPAERIVVPFFMVGNAGTTTLSSVTIGGVSATVQIFQVNLEFVCGIADAVISTAGSGTVVFNASDSNAWKRSMMAAYHVGTRTFQTSVVDAAADPADLSVNTTSDDFICGCGKLNNSGQTGMLATGGWTRDGTGNLEIDRWGAFFHQNSVAGGTPEAFGINDVVNIDNAVAAVYR